MTAWTTPTHVSSGEADSAKFNEETVDNLLNLHESRPTVLSARITGGPTSGTTELALTGSISIPAQAVDVLVVPSLNLRISGTGNDDYFQAAIRSTDVSGTVRGASRVCLGSSASSSVSVAVPLCEPYELAAGVPETLIATLIRTAGAGTASVVSTTPVLCVLSALIVAQLA